MSPFLLAIKKKTASLSLSLSLSTPSRRSLPHSYFSLFAQHSRRLPIKLNSVGKRIDESSSWNGFKIKRYTCFTVFRSSFPLPSILVLLCPTFFICNAMIVTVKQEPFYTKWLELVLLFPRGRERATVSFPHRFVSIFSFLAFSLSLTLSFSLSLFSYVDERKKKKGKRGGTERKAYCLAYAMANENSFGQGLPEIRFGVAILPFSSLINLSIKIFFIYFSFTLILLAGLKFQKRWVEILSFLALTRHSLEITNHRGAFKSFLFFTFHIFSFHSSPSSK